MNLMLSNKNKKLWQVVELLADNGGPLPMSRAGIYNAVQSGSIPSVKIGRRLFVPDWYIEKLTKQPDCEA